MFSRRAVFSAGAGAAIAGLGAVAAHRAGVLDDGLRGIGVKPHPEADPGDVRLLATAARDVESLLDLVGAALAAESIRGNERRFLITARAVITEHAKSLGVRAQLVGTEITTPRLGLDAIIANLAAAVASAADTRGRDAVRAVSPEVAQVLASMAAGLDQLVVAGKRFT